MARHARHAQRTGRDSRPAFRASADDQGRRRLLARRGGQGRERAGELRGSQGNRTTGVQEAHVKCDSLHDDCERLARELQGRDIQIADAVARCHKMASANTAALRGLAGSLQLVQAQAGGVMHVEVARTVVGTETGASAAHSKANSPVSAQCVRTRITNLHTTTE